VGCVSQAPQFNPAQSQLDPQTCSKPHSRFILIQENIMSQTPRRALVVIDVQNEYVSGNLPIEYPDVQLSLANIARAMDAARDNDIPVVVVQNTAPAGAPIFNKGTHGWELHAAIAERPRDHYLEKRLPSAFTGTEAT
jgi:nicotinamidase-related amidase